MELQHVLGNTYAAVANTALLPVYCLNETDIILIDTGYAHLDRSALTNLLNEHHFNLKGIICSHAHFDHTGNVRYLQNRYHCLVAAQIIEAGISIEPNYYLSNYVAPYSGEGFDISLEECFLTDVIIPSDADSLDFCGAHFEILQLPGHSPGHIGIITPDHVAYLGDSLVSQSQIDGAKLPISTVIAHDLQSKYSLRNLDCPAYIIAHKEITTDITDLIERNIAFLENKTQHLLDCLQDGMTFADWLYAFCMQEHIRINNKMKFTIVETNFCHFVDYLTGIGKVEIRRECCAKKYYHST